MARKKRTVITYFILILLAAALIAFNRFINSKKNSPPEKSYAAKLTELRAGLTKAAKAGNRQHTATNKRTTTSKSSKARPT